MLNFLEFLDFVIQILLTYFFKILDWVYQGRTDVYLLIDPARDFTLGSSTIAAPFFHTALQMGDIVISYNRNGIHILPVQVKNLLRKTKIMVMVNLIDFHIYRFIKQKINGFEVQLIKVYLKQKHMQENLLPLHSKHITYIIATAIFLQIKCQHFY